MIHLARPLFVTYAGNFPYPLYTSSYERCGERPSDGHALVQTAHTAYPICVTRRRSNDGITEPCEWIRYPSTLRWATSACRLAGPVGDKKPRPPHPAKTSASLSCLLRKNIRC